MSLNFKKGHIFGGPISSGSVTQLNRRKEIVSKRVERTTDDVHYLSSNAAWVRVTSSVDIENDGGPKNARKYQLFRGIGTADRGFVPIEDPDRTSYTESNEYGYVPIPGLTNFEVLTQNDLGTLRSANITFQVNSPEDFNKLEQLYLRPGYTLLLEWGHSVKVNNDGTIDSSIKYYDLDTFSTSQTISDIKKEIIRLREENSFNYDGMLGLVRNFSWTYNGGNYLCTVDVVSDGEILEGLTNDIPSPGNTDDQSEDEAYDSNNFGTYLQKILSTIQNTAVESFFETADNRNIIPQVTKEVIGELEKAVPKYKEAFSDLRIIAGNLAGEGISRESYFTKYIRLRDFLKAINVGGLLYNKDKDNIVEFYVGDEIYPFTTFSGHIGLDPGVCILPKKGRDKDYFIPLAEQANDLEETDLLNIFLSVDYIKAKYIEFSNSQYRYDNSVFSLLDDIFKDLNNNLGNINDFRIAYEEDTSTYHVIDTTVTPANSDFELGEDGNAKAYLDLVGLKSEVVNLEMKSSITSEFTTLIAIAAQKTSDPAALENIASLQRWNEGLVNRHMPEINTSVTKEEDTPDIETQKEKYRQFLKDCSKSNLFYLVYDKRKFTGYRSIHKAITRDLLKTTTELAGTNPPGIIPLILSFTMKGVSGIKVLQSFKINEFFLPERYRGRVSFIITKLDHKVESGRWLTTIEALVKPL